MDLDYLELLEKRVQEMIDALRSTKEEKRALEQQLEERRTEFQRLEQERNEVRQRVEKILGTLSHLSRNEEASLLEDEVEKTDGQETSY